jgi:hypothetical protein
MGHNRRRDDREERAARAPLKRADQAAAVAAVEAWNAAIAARRRAFAVPSIGAALIAGKPWLAVYCPGCRSEGAVDLRTLDRHTDACLTSLIPALSCRACSPNPPFAELRGLSRFKPDVIGARNSGAV